MADSHHKWKSKQVQPPARDTGQAPAPSILQRSLVGAQQVDMGHDRSVQLPRGQPILTSGRRPSLTNQSHVGNRLWGNPILQPVSLQRGPQGRLSILPLKLTAWSFHWLCMRHSPQIGWYASCMDYEASTTSSNPTSSNQQKTARDWQCSRNTPRGKAVQRWLQKHKWEIQDLWKFTWPQ